MDSSLHNHLLTLNKIRRGFPAGEIQMVSCSPGTGKSTFSKTVMRDFCNQRAREKFSLLSEEEQVAVRLRYNRVLSWWETLPEEDR